MDNMAVGSMVFALVAALGYGLSDFVGGLASRRTHVLRVVLVTYPVGLAGLLLAAPFAGGQLGGVDLVIAMIAGAANGLAIIWFYSALATGPMNVVSPLTALLVAGLPLIFGLVTGESLGAIAIGGALLAVIAVVLVSREERTAVDEAGPVRFTARVGWLTVGSGAAFAVYFVLLDQLPADSGLWPLVVSRGTATALVLAAALVGGQFRIPERSAIALTITAGLLDAVCNTAFLLALRTGLLAVVSVLTSLYPAATVLMARLVLGERTGRVQRVGLALAAVSVTLIAGGSAAA
ncbi:putative membrane protein [Kutzneria buriramensis]|uniref:Putative membrane protein n=2 Tax=Kutzneria buriramensis TaxID=1045776 RepID=A0A3E0H0H6_9PSEU|nr:putative membrane protein [Kutzneria buriramensis]